MSVSGIYIIRNRITDCIYIGSSKDIDGFRISKHKSDLRRNKHHSPYLQRSWNEHGEDAFEFFIVQECEQERLHIVEQVWLDVLQPEYNCRMKIEGRDCFHHTQESKAKISAASKRHVGWKATEEAKRHMSEAHKGKPTGRKGTSSPNLAGAKNGNSRLTTEDVIRIKQIGRQRTQQSIADEFNIDRSVVGKILRGSLWPTIKV